MSRYSGPPTSIDSQFRRCLPLLFLASSCAILAMLCYDAPVPNPGDQAEAYESFNDSNWGGHETLASSADPSSSLLAQADLQPAVESANSHDTHHATQLYWEFPGPSAQSTEAVPVSLLRLPPVESASKETIDSHSLAEAMAGELGR